MGYYMSKVSVLDAIKAGDFERTESGVIVPNMEVKAYGDYFHRKNGGPWEVDSNTVTEEFINYMLEAAINGGTPISSWYMTLFGVGQSPSEDWTASSFASLGTENTDPTEGYVSATRPLWDTDAAADGAVLNDTTATRFTFATTGSITIGGIALLSSDERGGSSGILASASKLNNSRLFEDGDTYDVIYRLRFQAA